MTNFNLNKINVLEVETAFGSLRLTTNRLTQEELEEYAERLKNAGSAEEFLLIQSELFEEINTPKQEDLFGNMNGTSFFGGIDQLFKKDVFGQAFRPFQNLFMDNITEEQIDRQIERLTKLKQDLVKHREAREKEEQKKQQRAELLKSLAELEVKLREKNKEFLENLESAETSDLLRTEMIDLQNQIKDVKTKITSL